ncbi:MAG: M20/M25/M40 family metallo-hydrolase [Isosphaeraceae bacterium]
MMNFPYPRVIGLAAVLPALVFACPVRADQGAPAAASETGTEVKKVKPLATAPVRPAESRLRADVTFLADDAQEGRGPGTKGIETSAAYIADEFARVGLKTAKGADGYFQPFTIPGDHALTDSAALTISRKGADKDLKLSPKTGFSSLSSLGATVKDSPLVFAGYGITAKDEKLKLDYDDYKGLDVKGKAVLILRNEPQLDDADSPFAGKELTQYAALRSKAVNADEHGAVLALVVNSKAGLRGEDDALAPNGYAGRLPLPIVMISRETADKILAGADQPTLKELETRIDADLKPESRALEGVSVAAEVALERTPIPVKNVIGVLEGAGPFSNETIVIGAHYDHLGRGGQGSLAPNSQEIHNGADDNASGTAMVMELARRLAVKAIDPLPRRIVFIAFSGEERGLLGSAHYVKEPLYPLNDTVAMINFDMVGRLNDKEELTIFGGASSPGLDALVEALGSSQGLAIKKVVGTGGEFFASDHASFYKKDIPVVFAFTGNHAQYHKPADDTELINFAGMAKIADVSELLVLDLARRPARPAFVKLGPGESRSVGAVRNGSGSYLGTRPAYGENDTPGVTLDGVSEGSPAEKAGLKGGDTIIRFGGKDVKDIEDFMIGLNAHKPGDEVEVVVRRDGKDVPLKATLGSSDRSSSKH